MTDTDNTFREGIRAGLKAMHRILTVATQDTYAACGYIARDEQNMAIGTLIAVEDQLKQAMDLYRAVLAMHRCRL